MTRIDERGAPIRVGEEERLALGERLAPERDVVAGYLFGSQAAGTAGPMSDVDIAIWLGRDVTRNDAFDRQLELMGILGSVLRTDEVQLVVLNHAPPLLAHRVLRQGILLVDRDPRQRVLLETAAVVRYLDTAPLREELSRGLSRRLGLRE